MRRNEGSHEECRRNDRSQLDPPIDETEFAGHEWHSDVERVSEESLYGFVRFLWSAVVGIAASE